VRISLSLSLSLSRSLALSLSLARALSLSLSLSLSLARANLCNGSRDVKFWAPKDGQLVNAWNAVATYHTQHKEALSECLWIDRGDLRALVACVCVCVCVCMCVCELVCLARKPRCFGLGVGGLEATCRLHVAECVDASESG
jgi:hypothetical protein